MARRTQRVPVIRYGADGSRVERMDVVAGEEPLQIYLDGEPWLVTMRTPGNDVELVHGLLLSEGIITRADQVVSVRYGAARPGEDERSFNTVNVVLDEAAGAVRPSAPARAGYVSGACGICGTPELDGLTRESAYPVAGIDLDVPIESLLKYPERMREKQELFAKTGGTHAAGLFVEDELVCVREDVGRHSAVDKAIGWALMAGRVPLHDAVLQVSGRASFELVQKAYMAGISVLAAVGATTTTALSQADEFKISVYSFSRLGSISLPTHPSNAQNSASTSMDSSEHSM